VAALRPPVSVHSRLCLAGTGIRQAGLGPARATAGRTPLRISSRTPRAAGAGCLQTPRGGRTAARAWRRPHTAPGIATAAGRLLDRPSRFPCALARCRPARTRSRISSLSNSARAAKIWSWSLPAAVVQSMNILWTASCQPEAVRLDQECRRDPREHRPVRAADARRAGRETNVTNHGYGTLARAASSRTWLSGIGKAAAGRRAARALRSAGCVDEEQLH
jgi:hypothetical protein